MHIYLINGSAHFPPHPQQNRASAAPDFLVFYMLTCQYSILYVNLSPADIHLALYISLENNTQAKNRWIFL
jgi:hypothetical protein